MFLEFIGDRFKDIQGSRGPEVQKLSQQMLGPVKVLQHVSFTCVFYTPLVGLAYAPYIDPFSINHPWPFLGSPDCQSHMEYLGGFA